MDYNVIISSYLIANFVRMTYVYNVQMILFWIFKSILVYKIGMGYKSIILTKILGIMKCI